MIFMRLLIVILFVSSLMLSGCNTTDSRCDWDPGICQNICTSPNYHFDDDLGMCTQYMRKGESKGCCTPPPFESLDECQKVCE